jgi:putative DNA primase/helicase
MPISEDPDWKLQLFHDDKGALAKNNIRNAALYLFNDKLLKEAFVFDEFHMQIMVQKDITGGNGKFKVHALDDSDIMQVSLYFERLGLLKDERKISSLINYVAHLNTINPAIDYFNSLKWDKVDRLDYWLKEAFDAPEPQKYLAAIGKKWVVAAVKRVFEPGCKFDHMLMLEGAQGAGKSSALELLAAFGEVIKDPYKQEPQKSYYTDALTFDAMGEKDCMLLTAGAIIVVLEELVGKSKRTDDDVKRWITLKSDKGRLPYARAVTEMKRQFVLAGTTNNYDYLRDPTGNRRYWCFTVCKVDKKYINDHREQIWAEAVHYYKEGLYLALEGDVLEMAEFEQKKRLEEDVWESAVVEALPTVCFKPFSTSDLMKEMNLPLRDQDARSMGRVKNILKKLGYENKPTREGDSVKRMWIKEND